MTYLFKAPTSNFWSTTLNGAINDTTDSITLNSTVGLQAPGYLIIDREDGNGNATPSSREVIYFTGIAGNAVTGVTRGADGSTARSHSDGALVEAVPTIGMWNDFVETFSAEHNQDGEHTTNTISEKTTDAGVTVDGVQHKDGKVVVSQTDTTGNALLVSRNLAAASTDSPVVKIIQDHTDDDQAAVIIQQDGNASALVVQANGTALASGQSALAVSSTTAQTTAKALAYFLMGNSSSNKPTVTIQNEGTGYCLYLDQNGNGKSIIVDSAATASPTVEIHANTTSGTVFFVKNSSAHASGALAYFEEANTSSTSPAFHIVQRGTGHAFMISQVGTPSAAAIRLSGCTGTSSKNPETDPEAGWIKIDIEGAVRYIPFYTA